MILGFCEKLESAKQIAMINYQLKRAKIEIPAGIYGLYLRSKDRYYYIYINSENKPFNVSIVRVGADQNVDGKKAMSDFLAENSAELKVAAVIDYYKSDS